MRLSSALWRKQCPTLALSLRRSYRWCWPPSPASSLCRWTRACRRKPPYCPTPSSSSTASTPSASRSASWRSVWAHVSGNQVLIIKPENTAEDGTPYHQKSNSSLLSLVSCRFLSRELASEDTKESRARIFSPKQLPSLQKRAVPRFSMAPCTSPDFATVLSAGSIPSLRHLPDIRGSNCPLLFLHQCVLNQCSCVLRLSRADTDICIYPFKL